MIKLYTIENQLAPLSKSEIILVGVLCGLVALALAAGVTAVILTIRRKNGKSSEKRGAR